MKPLVHSETIQFLSDGLETLHYRAHEIFTILVTPGSLPEVSGYTVSMTPYGCLPHSPPLEKFIGNTVIMFSIPNMAYPIKQRLKLLVVLE